MFVWPVHPLAFVQNTFYTCHLSMYKYIRPSPNRGSGKGFDLNTNCGFCFTYIIYIIFQKEHVLHKALFYTKNCVLHKHTICVSTQQLARHASAGACSIALFHAAQIRPRGLSRTIIYNVGPPRELSWFITPSHYSYNYHKP